MSKNRFKELLKHKLTHQYRMVIINDDTFEERFSLKLSRLNVFVLGGVFSVFLILITALFIAFSPIKEFIPGYASDELRNKALKATLKADSISVELAQLREFTRVIQPILTGEISADKLDTIQLETVPKVISDSLLKASKADLIYREKIESKDRFPILNKNKTILKNIFYAPISGTISQGFDLKAKHFAIDIVAKVGTAVKATEDGTVIFSGWTTDTGYVLIIKHSNNYISVYKHNGSLLKEQGDIVKAGEAIATLGSTGELTTGPHLHFEIWSDGYPVNPTTLIDFSK